MKSSRPSTAALKTGEIESFNRLSEPRAALVERIINGSQFRNSLRLREFLLYISECAIKGAPEMATEQQIGVHVFQRLPGYNSSEDSIVRSHARLLRQKLTEFFANEGADEPIVVEVPKGHYLPLFRARQAQPSPAPFAVQTVTATEEPPKAGVGRAGQRAGQRAWNILRSPPLGMVAGALLVLLIAGAVHLLGGARQKLAPRTAMEEFWAPFLSGDPPLVIYSNARFVGDSKSGLRYASAATENEPVVDHYTGIGELTAVYELTRLFDAHKATFILKRSLLVTWDEAKQRDLIFIGSPAENPSLNAVPGLTDFTMVTRPDSAGFLNNHPRPGEPAAYSRPEHPLTMDYAVIALKPGVQSGKRMLMFSGLTTLGTQAAVEFVSHKDTVAELLRQVALPNGEVKPFEALLAVTVEGGVPLESKLISVRVH